MQENLSINATHSTFSRDRGLSRGLCSVSERKGGVWASNKRDERQMTESKVGEIETRQRRESARPTRRDRRELRVEGVDDSMAGPEWRQQVEGDERQPVDNWASPALPSTWFLVSGGGQHGSDINRLDTGPTGTKACGVPWAGQASVWSLE